MEGQKEAAANLNFRHFSLPKRVAQSIRYQRGAEHDNLEAIISNAGNIGFELLPWAINFEQSTEYCDCHCTMIIVSPLPNSHCLHVQQLLANSHLLNGMIRTELPSYRVPAELQLQVLPRQVPHTQPGPCTRPRPVLVAALHMNAPNLWPRPAHWLHGEMSGWNGRCAAQFARGTRRRSPPLIGWRRMPQQFPTAAALCQFLFIGSWAPHRMQVLRTSDCNRDWGASTGTCKYRKGRRREGRIGSVFGEQFAGSGAASSRRAMYSHVYRLLASRPWPLVSCL